MTQWKTGRELPQPLARESDQREFLLCAALQQTERVIYFVEIMGFHPDTTFNNKPTALTYAATNRDRLLLEHLVGSGADVNHGDGIGLTPLHYAVIGGCDYCLSYLIGSGAYLNSRAVNGQTPLALAMHRYGKKHECVSLLLCHGANLSGKQPGSKQFH